MPRILAIPTAVFVLGMVVAGVLGWHLVHAGADREVRATGMGVLAAVDAVRVHAEDQLAAKPAAEGAAALTGVHAAERVASGNGAPARPPYRYHIAMHNPMAAHRRPTAREGRMIASLDMNRGLRLLEEEVEVGGRPMLALATPIAVRSEACLKCHSNPRNVRGPRALLPWPGMRWKVGQVVGASIVYVPAKPAHDRASMAFWTVAKIVAVLALACIALMAWSTWTSVVAPADAMLHTSQALRDGAWTARFPSQGIGPMSTLGMSLQRTTRWMRERLATEEKLRALFQQFVPAGVAARALGKDAADVLEGTRHSVTTLVVNVRNFHLLQDNLAPNDTITHLNEVFACINRAVVSNRGLVSKYLGDTVLAIFGMPMGDENHALNAVRAALAIPRALQDLYLDLDEKYGWQLGVGIGISTGEALVGHFGSEEHMEYTVLGDVVLSAHRLEDITRTVPEEDTICIDEVTYRQLMSDVHVYDLGERRASDGAETHAYVVQGFRSEVRAALAA